MPFSTGWTFPGLPPLTSAEARILEALADTVFPPDAGLPISGRQAHVVSYFEEMLSHLEIREQILLRGMLVAYEVQALATQPRAMTVFSRLTAEQREASLRAWDESPLYFARLFFQALKGVLLWAYVDNAEVGEAMGVSRGDEIIRAQNQKYAEETQAPPEAAASSSKGKR